MRAVFLPRSCRWMGADMASLCRTCCQSESESRSPLLSTSRLQGSTTLQCNSVSMTLTGHLGIPCCFSHCSLTRQYKSAEKFSEFDPDRTSWNSLLFLTLLHYTARFAAVQSSDVDPSNNILVYLVLSHTIQWRWFVKCHLGFSCGVLYYLLILRDSAVVQDRETDVRNITLRLLTSLSCSRLHGKCPSFFLYLLACTPCILLLACTVCKLARQEHILASLCCSCLHGKYQVLLQLWKLPPFLSSSQETAQGKKQL